MTKTKEQQISDAFATLNAIEVLEQVPEFGKFIERQRERVAALERSILDEAMPVDERENLRQHRFGMLDVLNAIDDDRTGAKKFLASVGVRI